MTADNEPTEANRLLRAIERLEDGQPRTPADDGPALTRFQRQLAAAVAELEAAHRADVIAAGGDPDDELPDLLDLVRDIATDYQRSRDNPIRARSLLDQLANDHDLSDLAALRLAGEAAAAAVPRAVDRAEAAGMTVPSIARALGLTPQRVYAMRQARVTYSYRVDVRTAGGSWRHREVGEEQLAEGSEALLAKQVIEEHTATADRHLRVRVWRGADPAGDPIYTTEHTPS
ncbi:hypothetical protein ACFV5N_23915 [Streptomyces sp. NPDC059853]|uniref:hypothetical protein n=1 Tax=Streptomyces sp. NPDC059853 TaxID=3346973 RepID=UPI0036576206